MDIIPQNIPQKQCARPNCQQWFPATPEFFHRDKSRKDKLFSWCKECTRKHDRERDKRPERREQERARTKTPEYREKRHAYLARPEVREREQVRARERARRPEVQEKVRAYHKIYYSRPEVREREKAHDRDYRNRPEAHERIRANNQRYYNRPGVREHQRAYHKVYFSRPGVREHHRAVTEAYRSRPEIREYRRTYARTYRQLTGVHERYLAHDRNRYAREKAALGTHTAAQIAEQLKRQRYRCYYAKCGFAKFQRVRENVAWKYDCHVEHTFPVSRDNGNDPVNDISYLVLACPACNQSKNAKYPWEWPEGGRLL